ncbi:unnamed protein product [Phytophthora fragariaefolia]|uniref:Unnamed protein product n=1 Tax=Phytophthora fragariaefolia TaxID=1490495 RepID=A0A9W6X1S1_9STRA|nr:unnamed protein product [Phytophthora fragariaefolia]
MPYLVKLPDGLESVLVTLSKNIIESTIKMYYFNVRFGITRALTSKYSIMRSGVTVIRAFARARPTTRIANGRHPHIFAKRSASLAEHPGATRQSNSVWVVPSYKTALGQLRNASVKAKQTQLTAVCNGSSEIESEYGVTLGICIFRLEASNNFKFGATEISWCKSSSPLFSSSSSNSSTLSSTSKQFLVLY